MEEKLQMILHESKLFSNLKQRWSFYKPSPSFCLVKVFFQCHAQRCALACLLSKLHGCVRVCSLLMKWVALCTQACYLPTAFCYSSIVAAIKYCNNKDMFWNRKKPNIFLLSFNIVAAAAPWKMNSFDLNDPVTFSRKHDVEDQF